MARGKKATRAAPSEPSESPNLFSDEEDEANDFFSSDQDGSDDGTQPPPLGYCHELSNQVCCVHCEVEERIDGTPTPQVRRVPKSCACGSLQKEEEDQTEADDEESPQQDASKETQPKHCRGQEIHSRTSRRAY